MKLAHCTHLSTLLSAISFLRLYVSGAWRWLSCMMGTFHATHTSQSHYLLSNHFLLRWSYPITVHLPPPQPVHSPISFLLSLQIKNPNIVSPLWLKFYYSIPHSRSPPSTPSSQFFHFEAYLWSWNLNLQCLVIFVPLSKSLYWTKLPLARCARLSWLTVSFWKQVKCFPSHYRGTN